ncbi:unnamed protein product [Dibothriocephalus latus]|uniref:Uncharacterized protein n=1 Tax=Dibothriocephalus latus TaxID=60516 RepID=A0A3P7PCT8_DIBLA|nr:unnamed protein product [Dibothriocephalus latus]
MKVTDTVPAFFYGLPNMQKSNVSLRAIVALEGIPTYNLAKRIYTKLKFLQGNSNTSVQSESQFLQDLPGRTILSDELIDSFNATFAFTSIPPNLAPEA